MRSEWPAALAARFMAPTVTVTHEAFDLGRPLGRGTTLRIGFAADLHAGPMTSPALIEAACAAFHAEAPDIILLGGDFVSLEARHAERLVAPLRGLHAPLGIFAVLGNHDHWAGAAAVVATLERAGVEVLQNRSVRLPRPFERTLLVGLDDHLSGRPDAAAAEWDAGAATILLLHQPSGLLDAGNRPFDVALAGHTHAGQIVLPGGFAPVVPTGALSRRYLTGRHQLDRDKWLLVSRGVGNSVLPIRYGAPSEVILCTLRGGVR